MRLTGLRVKHINGVESVALYPNDRVRLTVTPSTSTVHRAHAEAGPVVEVVADTIYLIASGAALRSELLPALILVAL